MSMSGSSSAYEVLSKRERRRIYDQSRPTDTKQDFHHDPKSDLLAYGLNELLNMLRMEEDLMMWEDAGLGQGWSFTMWDEGRDDDGDHLGDMFSML